MENKNTEIHEACRTGNKLTLETILSRDVTKINSRNKKSRTPVMEAVRYGNGEIYDFLVSKGCSLSLQDSSNNTLLHIACSGGSIHIVNDLLARNVHCINNRGHHGKTPVMDAAEGGHREVFFLLYDKGCVLSIVDRFGDDILHWACSGGSVEIVEYLLSQDNVDVDVKGRRGLTPVMTAVRQGHRQVFDMLVSRCCDLSLVDMDSRGILHHACFGGSDAIVEYLLSTENTDINRRSYNGVTPVMIAATKGHVNIFYLLVSKGCHLTGVQGKSGDNILHKACNGGSVEIVEYLLQEGTVDVNSGGQFGVTPAMIAALKKRRDVFEMLVNKGCDLTISDKHDDNVLHHASRGGSADIVELILSQNTSDINGKGRNCLTPIMIAAEKAHGDVFYLLLAQGCDMTGMSRFGDTLLHCACIGGNVEIVEYILSQDMANINSRGQMGATPIMIAAQKAKKDVFEILINRNCDLTLRDKNNDSLLHHACTGGSVEIVSYLLSRDIIYINSPGQDGVTPIMLAAYKGHGDVFDLLVETNCNISLLSAKRLSVLHMACLSGVVHIVEKLLHSGITGVALKGGEYGRTPLMMAALRGHKLVFDLLLGKGCDLNTKDNNTNNILHFASLGGNVDIVEHIIRQNVVSINSRGQFQRTAVMMAAENGRTEVFNFLLKRGCDLSAVDSSSNNILHAACVGGSKEIVEFVLSQKVVNTGLRGMDGKTAARLAANNGHREIVELLAGTNSKYTSWHFRDAQPTRSKDHID